MDSVSWLILVGGVAALLTNFFADYTLVFASAIGIFSWIYCGIFLPLAVIAYFIYYFGFYKRGL